MNSRVRTIGRGLGAFSIIAIVLLPIIRSYYYIGEADALSHLGIALDIKAGVESLSEQLYPLSHFLSVAIGQVTGIEIRRALMILLALFVIVFILFIPLTARLFSNDELVISISAFSALLLLPVNHFTGHMHPHTTSYAMFFVPFVIYSFILLFRTSDRKHVVFVTVSLSGMVLLHPQQAANIIILFGTVAIIQLIVSFAIDDENLSYNGRQIYPYVSVMLVIFWLWTEGLDKISGNLRKPLVNLLASGREPGGNVRSAAPSLEAAGGSTEEIFIKLFLIGFIYSVLAALLMGASLTEVFKDSSNRLYKQGERIAFSSSSLNFLVIYLTAGFIAIVGLFFVYILADQSRQYFRHYSFMMVIVTVLGSLALAQILKIVSRNISRRRVTTAVSILFIVFLLFSVPIIHISPYLYQESEHVPESQMKGFETAFNHQEEGVQFVFIRSTTSRYHDAIIGERKRIDYTGAGNVPYHFSEEGDLRSQYEEETYLVVTNRDRTRDRDLHRGVRYTREDYEHFDNGKGINRIQDNGGFTLYRITPPPE
ncbi:hypothetical protein ACFQKF_13720 [Halalkalicoccus sp. GCM10025322]|uniref:hypothetical protein n=1 Tax=Halalkalicoccus TaxID=332246 RepID=UPI002F966DDD